MTAPDAATVDRMVFLLRDLLLSMNRLDRITAEAVGMNTTDMTCLTIIEDAKVPVTAKMLSTHLGLSTGATTALIDRLEQKGYVVRKRHPTDRRGIIVALTPPAARGDIRAIRTRFREAAARAWAGFSQGDLETVQRFILTILDTTEAELSKAAAENGRTLEGR